MTPTSTSETDRKEIRTRTAATTTADTPTPTRVTAEPTTTVTRVDETSVTVRPAKTDDPFTAARPTTEFQDSDATTAVRPISSDATNENTSKDSVTPAVAAVRTETLSRLKPDVDVSAAEPGTSIIDDERKELLCDTATKIVDNSTPAALADVDPANTVAAGVISATTTGRLASSIEKTIEHTLPIAEPALPSGPDLPKATFQNASRQTVYIRFPSSSDAAADQDRALLGELLSSSTDVRVDVVASQTLFADATRLGLMLAAISHAGRRSGTMLAFSDVLDDPGASSSLHIQECRRRRTFGGRRLPIPRNGSQRRHNPVETIEDRTSIPASPSCDVLFADAAMMSVLFHEAEQRSSGSSRWNQTTVLGGLAAGTGGLAARRARPLRRKRAATVRPRPPQPRHHGKTLVFAD